VLQWLRANGCLWDEWTVDVARLQLSLSGKPEGGHLAVLAVAACQMPMAALTRTALTRMALARTADCD
jgi:hypothetical protein